MEIAIFGDVVKDLCPDAVIKCIYTSEKENDRAPRPTKHWAQTNGYNKIGSNLCKTDNRSGTAEATQFRWPHTICGRRCVKDRFLAWDAIDW